MMRYTGNAGEAMFFDLLGEKDYRYISLQFKRDAGGAVSCYIVFEDFDSLGSPA